MLLPTSLNLLFFSNFFFFADNFFSLKLTIKSTSSAQVSTLRSFLYDWIFFLVWLWNYNVFFVREFLSESAENWERVKNRVTIYYLKENWDILRKLCDWRKRKKSLICSYKSAVNGQPIKNWESEKTREKERGRKWRWTTLLGKHV
jgi:hypothetical protein